MATRQRPNVERYVGLLRAINVGGRNRLEMAALRSLFESLGFSEVATFIQSGNVLFTSAESPNPDLLSAEIERAFAVSSTVVLRGHQDLVATVANNPFPDVPSSQLHVGFMTCPPDSGDLAALDRDRFRPDRFEVVGREAYLYLPAGVAASKLPSYLDRQLKVSVTMRNWNTLNRLVDLTSH